MEVSRSNIHTSLLILAILSALFLLPALPAHADQLANATAEVGNEADVAIVEQAVSNEVPLAAGKDELPVQTADAVKTESERQSEGVEQTVKLTASATAPTNDTDVTANTVRVPSDDSMEKTDVETDAADVPRDIPSCADAPETTEEDAVLTAQASTGYDSSHVNMYRLYNPNSGEHFYTSDIEEATSVAVAGWQWEDVGWVAPIESSMPVYRLYNPNAGDHHYTLDKAERDWLISLGWNDEGIGWYSDATDQIAVLRQYNPNALAGSHNFTTSADEDASLGESGWNREGLAWYATDGKIVSIAGRWLITSAWGTLERYWIDSQGSIARARIIEATEGTGYDAYAFDDGSVLTGKYDTGEGYVMVADSEGRLAATADGADGWLVTAAYDGENQRYYYDASRHAMRSGFFTIDDVQYFGIGGEGYVLRGKMTWGDHVLLADNDGHMASGVGWLNTDIYDGGQARNYYLETVWSHYSGAKTGLFTVDGRGYFGVSGEGYVVEDTGTTWANGWWYTLQGGTLTEVAPEMRAHVNAFVEKMKAMAADNSHGYDQDYRWGEYGDYDCSSLVIYCLQQAGFDTGVATYTGNMRSNLTARGWEWRTTITSEELQAGVILLNERHHTAAMISTSQLAQASINENGGITGGKPGDQTGNEVLIRDYYDYPWDGVLIPTPWCRLA